MSNITKQSGLTFIEVLIALVILISGILGAVAMQMSAKKGSFDAMQRSVASALAQDIIERIRSNNSNPNTLELYQGTYGESLNTLPVNRCHSSNTLCSSSQMATNDIYEWESALMGMDVTNGGVSNGGLIGARACIEHLNNAVTVVISWQGRTGLSDGATDNDSFAQECGEASDNRHQIAINGFVF
jgi:type IV pilus assembly protein PilV